MAGEAKVKKQSKTSTKEAEKIAVQAQAVEAEGDAEGGSTTATTTTVVTKSVKKLKKHIERGIVKIKATFNNTVITITDLQGKVLATASAGMVGFKGSRKSTPFAAGSAADKVCQKVRDLYGMSEVEIFVQGPGSGFESAAKTIAGVFKVDALHEVTRLPHNGCRPRKRRRV